MLKNYLKIAWRNLFKHKGYTFINIIGLAVGIAVCTLIFKYVHYELSYDTFHQKANRTYRLTMDLNKSHIAVTPSLLLPTMTKYPEVETGVRLYPASNYSSFAVRYKNKVFEEKRFAYADSTFFDVFSFKLLKGNPETALVRPNTVVITKAMAKKYFGDRDPMGKTLTINNDRKFEVTGVMANMPDNSHFRMDFIASLITRSSWSQLTDTQMQGAQFYTYLVLDNPRARMKVDHKINHFLSSRLPDRLTASVGLQPLTDIHLYSDLKAEIQPQSDITYVWAASAIALLILIIACINYMNLATARSARRSQEVGIRKVLGSDRKRLIAQFYGESALITCLAIVCSILLIELFNPWFNQLIGEQLDVSFTSPVIWGLLLGMGLIITLLAGSYPALMLSSFRPAAVLEGARSQKRNDVLRKGLVIFQFAVSILLIIGTLVIYRQVQYMQHKKLGYHKKNVLVLTSHDQVENHFDTFKSLLRQNSGVKQATMVSETPTNILGAYSINVEGTSISKKSKGKMVSGLRIHNDFTETLDIDMVAGRSLTKTDDRQVNRKSGKKRYSFLVNQAMARYLEVSPKKLIGRRTKVSGRVGRIVGVVKDFHFAPLDKKISPLVMFPSNGFNKLLIRFNTDNMQQALQNTHKTWQKLFPNYPFDYEFLNQEYDALYKQETRAGQVFSRFAFFAIFVACLGLLGLSAYTVEQRTKEIGIRKVLGASSSQLVVLLSKDFTKLVLISILIAIPVGWWMMSNWLRDFAYHIDIKVWQFAIAGGAALVVAWLTVGWVSIRAALANPVNSLRSE
ncbi:MAG TPA: FtsX-like permease family protein [Balneolaceae bacterium]|nr:FtsX-like permease family protein [Balneolaceae bacterium]